MKVAPLIAVTLIICIAFPGSIQAKKKPKPNKFCIGKDGNQYAEGEGYDDNDGKACVHYKCVKKNKKKFIMKQGKCAPVDGEWGDWSSWSDCSATCGSATKKRTRTCSNPKPSNGGKPCRGQDTEVEECSLKACGPVENVNVTALELNLQSLNDTVQSLLELISTMQSTANKQGTCLSDLSSSECPASAEGKVGVVDGIAANTADISTNTAGLAYSKAGIATNQAGIATNQVGVATNQVGVATNQAGVATNKEDITSNNDTCSSIQATATKIETCLGDVNSVSCPSSKEGKTSVPDAIMKNKDAVQNHHSDTTTTITTTTTPAISSTITAGYKLHAISECRILKIFADGNELASLGVWSSGHGATNKSGVDVPGNTTTIQIQCIKPGPTGGILASADNGLKTDGTWTCSSDSGATWKPASFIPRKNYYTADHISDDAKVIWYHDFSNEVNSEDTIISCKTDVGSVLLHTDANYDYYKVPVPASSMMSSAVVEKTCLANGMTPQCYTASSADHKCVQAPSNPPSGTHPRAISKILCDTIYPADCAFTLNMFWYTIDSWRSGSACGATKAGSFCSTGKDYTSTSDMQYFAACLKPVTGWTIIQRRGQYGNAVDYFYKDFKDYEDGFGSVDGELWFGLKKLAALTNDGEWELQVDLTDWDDKKYHAKYATFSVGPAPTYTLHVGGFKDGESTLGDSLDYHDGQAFSARDKDQDANSDVICAVQHKGAWWYRNCNHANLNGLNYAQQKNDMTGMTWYYGKDRGTGIKTWKSSVMKIKRMKV